MTAEWPSSGGGGAPSGPAGGVLSGTYPDPGADASLATQAELDAQVALLAPLASPTFTGHPVGVTETAGNNSTRLASTAYADTGLLLKQPRFPKLVLSMPTNSATTTTAVGANNAAGARVIWPETGTINALGVFPTTQNGNLDLGVYDTSVTTRNRLVSTGSTAVGTVNTWQTIAVSLAVTAGDAVDLFVGSSGTAAFAGSISQNAALMTLPAGWMSVPLGGAPRFAPFVVGSMFPLPATFLESAFFATAYVPLIIARYA